MDHDEYIRRIKSYIKTPTKEIEQQLEDFAGLCTYVSGQYDKDESFQGLEQHLQEVEQGRPENHRLFYMALPPSVFTIVSQHLKKNCYPKNGVARVIVRELILPSCCQLMADKLNRSRSLSVRILPALANFKSPSSPTGTSRSCSESIITLARRWSRTF